MFIKRQVRSITSNPSDPRHIPDIISARINRPACDQLTPAEETAAATRISDQRTALWSSLASFAAGLKCRKSSAFVAWARENDSDDEALLALTSCARTIGGEYGGSEIAVRAVTLKRSKDSLAEHNLRLVIHCARRQAEKTGYIMPMADLINEGAIGLMKAVCRFDPTRGFRFSTMATWWIDHHIGRAIADTSRTIRFPVHLTEGKGKVTKAIAALAKAGITDPTDVMISRECTRRTLTAAAEKAGTPPPTPEQIERAMVANRRIYNAMTPGRVKAVRAAMTIATISAATLVRGNVDGDSDEREVLDFMPAIDASPDAGLLADERAAILDAALAGLKPATATILRRRFGLGDDEPMTLTQIGEDPDLGLCVSRERVRQVQNKGLAAARAHLARMDISAGDVAWA
mgnify:CR=1 FL=1